MRSFKLPLIALTLAVFICTPRIKSQDLPPDLIDPPREFSVMPFWFWNDTLRDDEIIRQIADFEDHGVYGFVIHPRIGLPHNITWLSDEMIRLMGVAISEASKRGMYVILYDEGMYPSGSSGGQVVAKNPGHAARGLAKIDLNRGEDPVLATGEKLITIIDRPGNKSVAVIEKPSGGVIRGIHYLNEGEQRLREDTPPAGDILNPQAVDSFIELVYERYSKEFGSYFGNTVTGIFTDEPSPLGRSAGRGMMPGNAALIPMINNILRYDITPHLAALWYNDSPSSEKFRSDYNRAVNICLEEIYYRKLGSWCASHNVALMGHPAGSMDIGTERFFQVPGQDLVWRYVEPGPKALEGQHSTMAKCASSAMEHLGLTRNSNELYGAYGHNLTREEMLWLANWCFVRGQNLLIPHAFYYSVRGPRIDERPPDVGPNSSWWDGYRPFADACRRLSWINTSSTHICQVAILSEATWLPDKPARAMFENQIDFNYLELRHLTHDTRITRDGIKIAGMNYKALVVDSISHPDKKTVKVLRKLASNGLLVINSELDLASSCRGAKVYNYPDDMIKALRNSIPNDIWVAGGEKDLRYRHVMKNGDHYYVLFNEGFNSINPSVEFSESGEIQIIDPFTGIASPSAKANELKLDPFELKLVRITTKK